MRPQRPISVDDTRDHMGQGIHSTHIYDAEVQVQTQVDSFMDIPLLKLIEQIESSDAASTCSGYDDEDSCGSEDEFSFGSSKSESLHCERLHDQSSDDEHDDVEDDPSMTHERVPFLEPVYELGSMRLQALQELAKELQRAPETPSKFIGNKSGTSGKPPVTYTHDEVNGILQVCYRLSEVSNASDLEADQIKRIAKCLRKWCTRRHVKNTALAERFMDYMPTTEREGYAKFFVEMAYAVSSTFLDRAIVEYCGSTRKIPSNMTYQQVFSKSKCTQQWGKPLYTIETRNLVERAYLYVAMFMAYLYLSDKERTTAFNCLTERTTHHCGYMTLSIDMDGKAEWHHGQDEPTMLMHWTRAVAIVDEIVKEFFDFQYNPDGSLYDGEPYTYKELNDDGSFPLRLQKDHYVRTSALPKHAILRRILARREPFKWHVHYPNIVINMETGRAIVGLINERLKADVFFGRFKHQIADEALYNLSGLRMLGMNKGRMLKEANAQKVPTDWPEEKRLRLIALQEVNSEATWLDVEEEHMDPLIRQYRDDPTMAIYLPVQEANLARRPLTFDDFFSCSILAPEQVPLSKQIKSVMQFAVLTLGGVEKQRDNIVDAKEEHARLRREKMEKNNVAEEMRRERIESEKVQGSSLTDGYLLDTHDDTVYQSVKVVLDYIRRHDPEVRETIKVFTKPPRVNIATASKEHLDKKNPYKHKSQHTYWQLSMTGLSQRCHDHMQCSKYNHVVVKFKDLPDEVTEFLAQHNIFARPRGFQGTPGIEIVKFALSDIYEELMMDPEDFDDCTIEFTDEGCEILFPNNQQRLIVALPNPKKELTDLKRNVTYVYWKDHGQHAIPLHGCMAGALAILGARRRWVGTDFEEQIEKMQTTVSSMASNLARAKAKIAQSDEQTRMSMYAQLEEVPEHALFYDKWLNTISRDLCTGRPSAVADLIYYVAFSDFAYEDKKWWCTHNGRWFSGDAAKSYLMNVQFHYQVNGFMQATLWYYKSQVQYDCVDVKKRAMNGLTKSVQILTGLTDTKDCYKMICQRFEAGGNLYCQAFDEGETMLSKMDTRKEYVCFENCVWNHETDWVGPPTPQMHLKFRAPIQFPLMETPDIMEQEKFVYDALRPIMQSDEMFDYLMMTIATLFLGENNPSTMYMWVGRGSNGKSVLENLLQDVMGDYVQDVAPTMFTRAGGNVDSPSPVMVSMKGKRLLIMAEPEGNALQSALIKRFTGGTEVQGRPLFSNQIIRFVPMAQCILQCNELPYVDKFDGGIARRVVVIPFVNQFKADDDFRPWNPRHRKADPRIFEKLKANRQGFLSLMVRYYRRLRDKHAYKMPRPREVQEATENWLCSNDIVYDFKTRYCRPDKGTTKAYTVKELHTLITQYFNDTYGGKHPVIKVPSLSQLGERLWSCGYDLEENVGQRSPVNRYKVVNTLIRTESEIEEGENVTATALDNPYGRKMLAELPKNVVVNVLQACDEEDEVFEDEDQILDEVQYEHPEIPVDPLDPPLDPPLPPPSKSLSPILEPLSELSSSPSSKSLSPILEPLSELSSKTSSSPSSKTSSKTSSSPSSKTSSKTSSSLPSKISSKTSSFSSSSISSKSTSSYLIPCIEELHEDSILGQNPEFAGKFFKGTCIEQRRTNYQGPVFVGCETESQHHRRTYVSSKCDFKYKHAANIWDPDE